MDRQLGFYVAAEALFKAREATWPNGGCPPPIHKALHDLKNILSVELCPFCGSSASLSNDDCYDVSCNNPGCEMNHQLIKLDTWNTRHDTKE